MILPRSLIAMTAMVMIFTPILKADQDKDHGYQPLFIKPKPNDSSENELKQQREMWRNTLRNHRFQYDAWTPEDTAWWESVRESPQSSTWLGIQLAPVPAALSAHLKLDEKGLMIRNVFVDSPADRAGLQRYDVIVKVNGKEVTGQIDMFRNHILGHQAGQEIKLTIYRTGKTIEVTSKLGERPENWDNLDMKYEEDPDVFHWKDFGIRGKILRPRPEGGWSWEDLGELPKSMFSPGWQQDILEYLHNFTDCEDLDQGKRIDKQGRVLHVQRKKNGTIEVRRYKETDGEEQAEVKTYKNMDELKKSDPEAHELLRSARRKPSYQRWIWRDRNSWPFKQFLPPEEADKKWREWRDKFFQGPIYKFKEHLYPPHYVRPLPAPELKTVPPAEPSPEQEPKVEPQPEPKITITPSVAPKITFDINAEGEITVHLRDQDAELNMTFKSKEALKEYSTKLYDKFGTLEKKLRNNQHTEQFPTP
ncbi:MAG: PDZ domain-containing protein [Planctomycetota bacterium]|nr:MAG: PDZ domain-containing protein [Planctomycetota bacterium]